MLRAPWGGRGRVIKGYSTGSGSGFSLGSWLIPLSHQPTDFLHEAVNCFEPQFSLLEMAPVIPVCDTYPYTYL